MKTGLRRNGYLPFQRSDAAYTAHRVLSERHLQLAATAELVADMPDAEPPQSSSLEQTGDLIRRSYGDAG